MTAISLPTALAIGSAAVGAVGAGVSYMGTQQAAEAQKQASDYQATVAANNAIIANQNAEATTQAGQVAATTTNLRSRALLGSLTAGEGASGVDVNTGSNADTRATQRELGQLDTMTQVSNAALRAYGFRSQSTSFTAQAGLDTATGQNAIVAGDIAGTTGLLGSASSLGLKFAQLQNAGALGGGNSAGFVDNTSTFVPPP